MKKFLLFVSTIISFSTLSQYPKLIIQFTNKANNQYALNNAAAYLSPRALLRRTRQNINIDSTDLPISQPYIDSLKLAGNVIVLSRSKWLNQVLIQTTDAAALAKIKKLPFVKNINGVGFRAAANRPANAKLLLEEATQNLSPLLLARKMNDVISYGNAYAQIHLHEGEYLHNKGYKGENIQIAVLDAGFYQYKTNTAFDSVRLNRQILGEADFVAFDNSVNEDDNHGANCLSILTANWPGKMVGTAPHALYWLIRTENAPSEYPVEEHNWVAGAEYADSCGADMISSSLGYTEFDEATFDHTYSQFYKNSATVTMGATLAAKKGMIVMNSAGNEGTSSWKYQGFPADADSVCAVGAVNAAGQIASFSSYGYPGKVKPNIVSLGAGTVIAGSNNQPVTGNGTSYSNPNVAGLIACLWQAFPTFNNMQILDAVYKSSDRYPTPTDRYGYGIPNFKTAYRSLKKQLNIATFGSNWLVALPNPFTTAVNGTFVGQVDGNARIEFLNATGQVLYTKLFFTEKEEVYNFSFTGLDALAGGNYLVKYADSLTNKGIALQKTIAGNNDWLRVSPGNVFTNNLAVTLTAPETGQVALNILDVKGSRIATQKLTATLGQTQQFSFNLNALPKGVYFLQYISKNQQRVVRLLKL